jgi:hypothetical protein
MTLVVDDARQHLARRDVLVSREPVDVVGDPPAAGKRVSPGLSGPVEGLVAPGPHAGGTLCPRTLACGIPVGRRDLRAGSGHASSRMRGRGRAVATSALPAPVRDRDPRAT